MPAVAVGPRQVEVVVPSSDCNHEGLATPKEAKTNPTHMGLAKVALVVCEDTNRVRAGTMTPGGTGEMTAEITMDMTVVAETEIEIGIDKVMVGASRIQVRAVDLAGKRQGKGRWTCQT